MNKSQVIGGGVCLALGALLAVLTVTLPADKMMFTIGDRNMPIVPAIILMVIGVVLIATARQSEKVEATPVVQKAQAEVVDDEEKRALNKRLEGAAWGLFLIMLGGAMFVSGDQVPDGLWSIGVGLIMLGLNAARYYYGIKLSGFTTVLGILALVSGVAELLGLYSAEGPVLLIILGLYLIAKPWFEKRQIFQ